MIKQDGRKLDHKTLETLRMHAVRRVMEDGEEPSEVMRSLGLCRTSIYLWLRRHKRGGASALRMRKASGPKPKLTEKQRQQVRRWIVGKDPRQYGFDFGLWTRRIVADMLLEKFGVTLTLPAVGRLLASLEITPQKPLRRAYERDPKAIANWLNVEFPRLRQRAKKESATIFYLDEAGFTSEPVLGRTYGLKGRTPVVTTTGQRQKVNAISAVNAKGAFWSQVYTGNFNAGRFVEFLKDFRRGGRGKVFLVVDGHPSHKAKIVAEYVKATKGQLEIHFLPPYAPDLNPDEFVWQHAKTNGAAKRPLKQNESLAERVRSDLAAIKARPALVRSFFQAQSVVYTIYGSVYTTTASPLCFTKLDRPLPTPPPHDPRSRSQRRPPEANSYQLDNEAVSQQFADMAATTITVPAAWIESIGDFRLPPQADRHLQTLMDRNNEGLLQPLEKDELAALAALSEEISLLRAEALHLLGKRPA